MAISAPSSSPEIMEDERMWITRGSGYEQAAELTRCILDSNRVDGPAVPIFDLCRTFGLDIRRQKLAAGCLSFLDVQHRVIFHAPMSTERASFYVAHELGHYLLPRNFNETSFNTFAECLLMPESWIREDCLSMTEYELRARYGVSVIVLRKRLRRLRAPMQFELFSMFE